MQFNSVAYVAIGMVIVPFVVGLLSSSRLPRDMRPLLALFGIHAIITVAQLILAVQKINNLWTSHLYYLTEVVFLLWVYSLWTSSERARTIFRITTILYAVFWITAKFLFEDFTKSALYTPTVSRVILLGSTLSMLVMLASRDDQVLYLQPKFWFAAGFLVLFAGSLMYYALRTLFFDFSRDVIDTIFLIHWINSILSNSLHTVGFLWILRRPNTGGQLELAP